MADWGFWHGVLVTIGLILIVNLGILALLARHAAPEPREWGMRLGDDDCLAGKCDE